MYLVGGFLVGGRVCDQSKTSCVVIASIFGLRTFLATSACLKQRREFKKGLLIIHSSLTQIQNKIKKKVLTKYCYIIHLFVSPQIIQKE